jgi:hypothetical protein
MRSSQSSSQPSHSLAKHDEDMPDVPGDPLPTQDSDSEAPLKKETYPRLPAHTLSTGTAFENSIVISSDDSSPAQPQRHAGAIIDLSTPVKRPPKKPLLKLTNRNSPVAISDSEGPDPENLPPLEDTAAIAKFNHPVWIKLKDEERLLISVLHGMPARLRDSLFALVAQSESQLWLQLVEAMSSIRQKEEQVTGLGYEGFKVSLMNAWLKVDVHVSTIPYRTLLLDRSFLWTDADRIRFYRISALCFGFSPCLTSANTIPLLRHPLRVKCGAFDMKRRSSLRSLPSFGRYRTTLKSGQAHHPLQNRKLTMTMKKENQYPPSDDVDWTRKTCSQACFEQCIMHLTY